MVSANKLNNSKNLESIYPLSPMQQGMLFHTIYAPETGLYFQQLTCTIHGKLDLSIFQQAWQRVVARHPVLRTLFLWEKRNNPLQIVCKQVNLPWVNYDWRLLSPIEQLERLEAFLQSDRNQGFELNIAPLMRCTLICIAEDTYKFIWSHHHLLIDGWSGASIIQEVFAFYQALRRNDNLYLKLPCPYREYISWLQQQDITQAEAYWRQLFKGFNAPTPLTVDKPLINQEQLSNYSEQEFHLSELTTTSLQFFARQHQLTLSNLLQGAWAILLSRYSGESDVIFGITVSGRPTALLGVESMIGLFINTLPVRVSISHTDKLLPWLKHLQEQLVESEQYSYSPLVEIQGWSEVPRGIPLFESIIVFENYPVDDSLLQEESSLTISQVRSIEQTNYPLTIVAVPGKQLSLRISYNNDRFHHRTINRILGHLQILLEGMVADSDQHVTQLSLLTATELQQLLVEWNNTLVEYPQDQCIHQLFELQVKLTPEAVGVVFENQQLTYQELNERANQLAHHLRSLGVKPDVLVGICVERSLEMIVGLLGILKAGGAYVPLDPDYPHERLAYMLEDAQVSVLVTQQKLVEQLPKHRGKLVCLDQDWNLIDQESQDNLLSGVQVSNLAYVIYTSGSTGQPKGVMNTHAGISNRLFWMQDAYTLTPADCVLQKTPFSFDVSVWEFFWPLLNGVRLVIAQPGGHQDSNYLVNLIAAQKITTLHFVPSMLQVFLQEQELKACKCLRQVVCSGEALPWELQERFFARLDAELHNLYGPTEAAIDVTFWQCKRDSKQQIVPIGRPIANTQLYILDCHLQPVPIGVPGELHIGGIGLARGYLNRPDLTKQRFIPHPFSDQLQARLYKTGDLARYLSDGNIEYLRRIDHQVKIRGFRIELGEIEATLNQHPDVLSVVVIAREDVSGDKRLVAYLVTYEKPTPTISELRQFLSKKLPEYMIPSAFVYLESLPLMPNGKIDRRNLPAPEIQRPLEVSFVAPRNPVEEMLVLIWGDVLGVEQVGIEDNFFTLGGHSLLATQLVSRVRTSFNIELPLRSLFESPTVAELAQYIQQWQRDLLEESALPLQAIPRDGQLPLSFAQQRLWFLDQLEPNSAFYNMPGALRLQGQLNLTALEESFSEIIRRHEALRTNFITQDGQAVQIIHPVRAGKLEVVDLQPLPINEREQESQRLAIAQAQRPFDLEKEPLVRVTLLVLSEEEYILLLTIHHIVSDGWSMGIFVQEIAALYFAFSQAQPTPLPELPIQYVDFAVWQRQWLQGKILEEQLTYWQQQLAEAPALLQLPTDRPRPTMQTVRGAHQSFLLPVKLTEALNLLSRQESATLFMILLAGFDILLYHYTGQTDIVVGSPIANRNRSEIEPLIGFFVNTLVMRTDLSGNPSFRELLKRVREITLGAYANQDLPFEMLVEALQPERHLSHTPLFQVMLILQNAPMSEIKLPDLVLSPWATQSSTATFDLTLSFEPTADGLLGSWEYNTDLFDDATINRMAENYQTLLEGIVANPEQRISKLPLLTEAQKQLLEDWNDTDRAYPENQCIHQLFESQVEKTPDGIAVVFGNQKLTYRKLNERANQLANHLRSLEVDAQILVGIYLERSLEIVIGVLAVFKAGGAYIPLDPDYPQERLRYMLAESEISILLTTEKLVAQLPENSSQRIYLDVETEKISQLSPKNLNSQVSPENLAYIIYTSGSTGKPKGVMITHHSLVNAYWGWKKAYELESTSTHLQMANFSFDVFTGDMVRALCSGGKLVLCPRDLLLAPEQLYQLMLAEEIDCGEFVPVVIRQLMEYLQQTEQNLSFMRVLVVGSDSWYVQEYQQLQKLCGQQTRLINSYGVSEATIDSCYFESQQVNRSVDALVPIGKPFDNIKVYILDSYEQPVPIGVPGELHIGGAGLARGYLNRPELTQEKFIPNPFSNEPQARLYKTGDIARFLADGNIEFLGRIDHQVKIRGFRIELAEIEAVLSQHPAVLQTAVIVREDVLTDKRLVAYIVPYQEQTPTMSELRQFLSKKLPEYMIPSAFVNLEVMPLTPNGKINHRALPIPDVSRSGLESSFIAPRNPMEEVLVQIWADVLGIEQVGIHDNFFTLGGHSLLATQLVSRVRTALKVELPLRSVFEAGTVADLAEYIHWLQQDISRPSVPTLQAYARDGQLPLSWAQQRLWFINELEGSTANYNIPAAIHIAGHLDIKALQQALSEIVRRHEILRTSFHTVNGTPIQVIHPEATININLMDLQQLEATERKTVIHQQAQLEAITPFNLKNAPLIRCSVLLFSATEYVLLLTMHHIVSDGWSMGVFIREITVLYQASCDGVPSPLPELPIQYADFAVWQRQWLQGEVLEAHISYWKQQLGGNLPILELPTDRPRPAVQTFCGGTEEFELDADLTQKLKLLSENSGTTLFMTLLAAFVSLLSRYSNQEDIIVGTDIANRNQLEIEGLIGFFVNQLVLRIDVSGNSTFRELLFHVRQVVLGAYTHQDLPFDKLVEVLNPQRNLSNTPLFQVKFVFEKLPTLTLNLPNLTLTTLEIDRGVTQNDLILFLSDSEQELTGCFQYNKDLFNATTISLMSKHLITLLGSISAQPDAQLKTLEMLTEMEKRQQAMEKMERKSSNLNRLKNIKPKMVSLLPQDELIKTDFLKTGETLPLVVRPAVDDIDLVAWTKSNQQFIETKLLKHGAILFRGFTRNLLAVFEQFALTICSELFNENGEHPREQVSSNVYTPVFYPSEQKVLLHNENSFNHSWPMKIWFGCVQPAQQGGETPVVDSRKVFELLDPKIKEQFMQKQIMYVRNYGEGLGLSWQTVFQTSDKSKVEEHCRKNFINFEWNDGDRLRTYCVRPAVVKHPKTGEISWFNQAQHWHFSCLPQATRESLLALFPEEYLPRTCYYGDGSRIENSVMQEIYQMYEQLEISFPWEAGDILMLDNMLVAHGRNPFLGERKIIVALGEMRSYANI